MSTSPAGLLTSGDDWQWLATNLRLIDDHDDRLCISTRTDISTWLDRQAATIYRQPFRDRAAGGTAQHTFTTGGCLDLLMVNNTLNSLRPHDPTRSAR